MPELLSEDLWWCVAGIPDAISDVLHDKSKPCFLAGGYIRSRIAGEPVNDIDLFVSSVADAKAIAEKLANGTKVFTSDNALSFKVAERDVQIIYRWTFATPQECVLSFDFTIARSAIWWDGIDWRSVCDDRFYADLAAGRLVYCNPHRNEDAGGSILRALKFTGRGYRIPPSELGKVIARLMSAVELPKVTDDTGKLQEERLGFVLAGLLYEVDPNSAERVARKEKRR